MTQILIALQQIPETENVLFGGVTELDETFVLDAYKGKKLPDTVERKARKHGAKAVKRGISNEYVCICAVIQRNGAAYVATNNRAKASANELVELLKCFYHLNTVNGFHSFIKQQYNFYRGVATKYLNRYNVLFSTAIGMQIA